MRSAAFVFEGTRAQADLVRAVLRHLCNWYEWKHVINYELTSLDRATMTAAVETMRDAWWPLSRRLLQHCGQLELAELMHLQQATDTLDAVLRQTLGSDAARLCDAADAYYVAGSIPLEWMRHEGVPLCLYASFYRFAKPQHIMSLDGPPEDGAKLFIAPKYVIPALSGVNQAVAESALWVHNDSSVMLLQDEVTAASLHGFRDKEFARLAFHGHAGSAGLLASDGTVIPFAEVLRVVRGPAFLLGCSTGAFETGALRIISDQIPLGLHGALLSAFPTSSLFTKLVNEMIVTTFRRPRGGARRVQDIAHMSRLALAWMGILYAIRSLAGVPIVQPNVIIVTPFEADYEAYTKWGVGVARLREELRDMPKEMRDVVIQIASAFAMSVVSCGTPGFLLPDADPRVVDATRAYIRWDGRVDAY